MPSLRALSTRIWQSDRWRLRPTNEFIQSEKDLIEPCKLLGTKYEMGYQPLMREALKRFIDGEFKMIASEALEKQKTNKQKTGKKMAKAA